MLKEAVIAMKPWSRDVAKGSRSSFGGQVFSEGLYQLFLAAAEGKLTMPSGPLWPVAGTIVQ
jgi:hypothetical protein